MKPKTYQLVDLDRVRIVDASRKLQGESDERLFSEEPDIERCIKCGEELEDSEDDICADCFFYDSY